MKINLKVRAKNPNFWFQIIFSIASTIAAYFGLTGADIYSWSVLWQTILNALGNPYVCFLILVSIYNSIVDPTTVGFSDSERALSYDKPSNNYKGDDGNAVS